MKTDTILGLEVRQYLEEMGVETPMVQSNNGYSKEDKLKYIAKHFRNIMQVLGLDLRDDSLENTPTRVAEMYVNEMFSGLDYNNFPKATAVENKMKCEEMLTVNKISLQSNCEHHFVVIDGFCKIAYIPKEHGKLLGLSKFNRIVQFFARRPQIQERLGLQIYHALSYILDTEDIAVSITAIHYCVKARGVNDTHSETTTSKLGGRFMSPEVRAEFFKI
jgi:GTP cyclohydrolase I